jgi:hypothetical protein
MKGVVNPGYKHVVKGKGMPVSHSLPLRSLRYRITIGDFTRAALQISKQMGARGDLVIEFSVIFPASLNEPQKQMIAAAL